MGAVRVVTTQSGWAKALRGRGGGGGGLGTHWSEDEGGGGGRGGGGGESGEGRGGGWAHIGRILLKDLKPTTARWGQWQRRNQGRPGGDNGRGVKAVRGGGREGGW